MIERHDDPARQSGRTTCQMQELPHGALFVWCNTRLDYPQELAKAIGREDLHIVSPNYITRDRWRNRMFPGVVYDHACFDIMTTAEFSEFIDAYQKAYPSLIVGSTENHGDANAKR